MAKLYYNNSKVGGSTLTTEKVQFYQMPNATSSMVDRIVQYIGPDTENYKQGYFYKCVYENYAYSWKNIFVLDSINGGSTYENITGTTLGFGRNLTMTMWCERGKVCHYTMFSPRDYIVYNVVANTEYELLRPAQKFWPKQTLMFPQVTAGYSLSTGAVRDGYIKFELSKDENDIPTDCVIKWCSFEAIPSSEAFNIYVDVTYWIGD